MKILYYFLYQERTPSLPIIVTFAKGAVRNLTLVDFFIGVVSGDEKTDTLAFNYTL